MMEHDPRVMRGQALTELAAASGGAGAPVEPAPQPEAPPERKMAPADGAAKTSEPPLSNPVKKAPVISESRSMGGAYAQSGGGSKERCKVGFWNLTGRDVVIRIDGQTRTLAKDRSLTIDSERAFSWQLDEGQTVAERVPEEQLFHEVILRQ